MKSCNVLPSSNGWIFRTGDGDALFEYESKFKCVARASEYVRLRGGALRIHDEEATLLEEREYPGQAAYSEVLN